MRKINQIIVEWGLLLFVGTANAQSPPSVNQTAAHSACVNIVALAGSKVDCSSLTPEQKRLLKNIPDLLKKILDKQPDLAGLKAQMNQIYALVQANSASSNAGATISIDNKSDDNYITGTRAINVPLGIKVDHQSDRNTITDSEAIKDCVAPDIPHEIVRYKDMSNESLRQSVSAFASQLREFASSTEQAEVKREDERIAQFRATVDPKTITKEKAIELGAEGREIYMKEQSQLAASIGEKFLEQATEYREELRWRLQKHSLLQQESFTEMINTFWPGPGVTPELNVRSLQQTAAYLENLAGQLPQ